MTFNGVKLRFRNFALSLLPKISSSAFRTSAWTGLRKISFISALVLPGIPNMGKSTSAFHLCRNFPTSENTLPHFCFALTAKDVKFCFLSSAVRSYDAFPHKFVLSLERRVSNNRNHLIDFTVSQVQKIFLHVSDKLFTVPSWRWPLLAFVCVFSVIIKQ